MKKTLLFLLMALFITGMYSFTMSPRQKAASRAAIRRTAVVIRLAHKKVKENKVYTGDLLRSVRHQRYACVLWKNGKYARAYHHTRRARQLAFLAIKANKGAVDKSWEMGKDEIVDGAGNPSDEELEKELPNLNLTEEELIENGLGEIDLNGDE